jgi:hypothetical protein
MYKMSAMIGLSHLRSSAQLMLASGLVVIGSLFAVAPKALAATCTGTQTVHNAAGLVLFLTPDVYGTGRLCLTNSPAGGDNFTVSSSMINNTTAPQAYPDLDVGCGIFPGTQTTCTAGNPLPIKESAMAGKITFTASHSGVAAADRYDTSADLFFSSDKANTSGPVSEVMVWANEQNQPHPSRAVSVTLDSRAWWRWTDARSACSGTCNWTEVIYLLQTEQNGFSSGITRKPILNNAVSIGALSSSDYLQYEGVGNEIWIGGTHLKITAYNSTF